MAFYASKEKIDLIKALKSMAKGRFFIIKGANDLLRRVKFFGNYLLKRVKFLRNDLLRRVKLLRNDLLRRVKLFGNDLLNFILPPSCLSCTGRVDVPDVLCSECWRKLKFITGAKCISCGFPFDFSLSSSHIIHHRCGSCMSRPRKFDGAVSALEYDEGSRSLILAFKHGDQEGFAALFARFLRQAGSEVIEKADIIAPVPLHLKRLQKRRYNQSALLAAALKEPDKKCLDLLIRHKNTPPQQGDYRKRRKNLQGAFQINPKYKAHIKGKDILLLDDVFTTGVTAENCARVLKKSGAKSVKILTIARAVTPPSS
jgi:ComF family protein